MVQQKIQGKNFLCWQIKKQKFSHALPHLFLLVTIFFFSFWLDKNNASLTQTRV